MAAGKLVLLLLAGGIAGAAFAGISTRTMHFPRSDQARAESEGYGIAPARRSWLDEGLSVLDTPAWPFGPAAHEPPPDAYSADGTAAEDGPDGFVIYPGPAPHAPELSPALPPESPNASTPEQPNPMPTRAGGDAASDAAARAANAAQDVIAAENAL